MPNRLKNHTLKMTTSEPHLYNSAGRVSYIPNTAPYIANIAPYIDIIGPVLPILKKCFTVSITLENKGGGGGSRPIHRFETLFLCYKPMDILAKTSPSKMEETRMLTRETIFTGDNQKCLEVPF